MVRVPAVDDEDRRRIGRERKALIEERKRHVNRIKDCSSALASEVMSLRVATGVNAWMNYGRGMAGNCLPISRRSSVVSSIDSNW